MAKPLSPWTDQLVQKAEQLYLAGHPKSAISDILYRDDGVFFSRNAICGKLMRRGVLAKKLPPKPKVVRPRRRPQPLPRLPRGVSPPPPPFTPRVIDAAPLQLSIYDLDQQSCRYECSGQDDPAAFTFCGHPTAAGSYCRLHADLCFIKPQGRPHRPIPRRAAA